MKSEVGNATLQKNSAFAKAKALSLSTPDLSGQKFGQFNSHCVENGVPNNNSNRERFLDSLGIVFK